MQVTNLIRNIGKCRDLIQQKDLKKLIANNYLFLSVYKDLGIQVHKYCEDPSHELDFTYHDLKELSDEIGALVDELKMEFSTDKFIKDIQTHKLINNKVVANFNQNLCDTLALDRNLRECQKVLAYLAYIVWLWGENYQQRREEEDNHYTVELTKTIRSFYNG